VLLARASGGSRIDAGERVTSIRLKEASDGGFPLREVRQGRDGPEGLLRPPNEEGVTS